MAETTKDTPGDSIPNRGPYKHLDALIEMGEDYTPEDRIDYAIHVLIDEVTEMGGMTELGGLAALPPGSLSNAGLTLIAAEQALMDLRAGSLSTAEDYVRLGERQLTGVPKPATEAPSEPETVATPGYLCDEDICDSPLHVRAVMRAELKVIRESRVQMADDSMVEGYSAQLTCYPDRLPDKDDKPFEPSLFSTDLAKLTAVVDAILEVGYVYVEGHMWLDRHQKEGEPLSWCEHPFAATSWRPATPEEVQAVGDPAHRGD